MPNFKEPICPSVTKLTEEDIKALIEQCIADEYEAAFRYRKIAELCSDKRIRAILEDVAKEEIVHAGEFRHLLSVVYPEEQEAIRQGEEEAISKLSTVVDNSDEEQSPDKNEDEDGSDGTSGEPTENANDNKNDSIELPPMIKKIRVVRVKK